jgi:hypothetical protein
LVPLSIGLAWLRATGRRWLVDAGRRAAGNGDDHGQFAAPSLLTRRIVSLGYDSRNNFGSSDPTDRGISMKISIQDQE